VTSDNASAIQTGYGLYVEARRTNNADVMQGAEIDVINMSSTTPTIHPHFVGGTGITPALWLSSGRTDVASSNAATAAMGIIDNGANFASGVVSGLNALRVTNGQADAVVVAYQHAIKWREPATATMVAQIHSDCTNASGGGEIAFVNDGAHIQDAGGHNVINVNASAASMSSLSMGGSVTFHDPATSTAVGTISNATTKAGGGGVSA
jgi:hypothetical protein